MLGLFRTAEEVVRVVLCLVSGLSDYVAGMTATITGDFLFD